MGESAPPHIIMLPTPGMGHLIPMVELARKLLYIHSDLTITFIFYSDTVDSQTSLLRSLSRVNTVVLTTEGGDDVPDNESLETKIVVGVIQSIPSLRRVLIELLEANSLSVFIADAFGAFTFEVVKELKIPAYLFFPSSATTLSLSFYFMEFSLTNDGDFKDVPQPLKIPGFTSIDSSQLPDVLLDRRTKGYEMVLEMVKMYFLADGILVNSFLDLEPDAFNVLHENRYGNTPEVYGVGPLIRSQSTSLSDAEARPVNWLDNQPANSVLFVSFGSGGTLSSHQLTELATGLEASQQRFLFVVRKPNDGDKSAAYFHRKNTEDYYDYLPTGFLERTKDRGLVLQNWAPQVEILGHPSVGGFLTHCGWNSTLESIVHGVPLIAWPLFAEQKTNAVLLTDVLKVAIRVKENEKGIVDSLQIECLARRLMKEEEGDILREKMMKLKVAAVCENGSSIEALDCLAKKWNF